eukprot:TRINITY_DN4160_c0_g2_i1.p1 TRINITY_DN4160_c0_g2~~TRINITY_DN4160_c0_g2_i1.p1  ORF type:complete len:160 (-),score=41.42 TRINITY_DN4160_c0_g2_i1:46-525(-)
MYASIGAQDTSFPDTSVEWREMIYFRSFQAGGLAKILYYTAIVFGLIYLIVTIVDYTRVFGAGGFFLGLLYGVLYFIFVILGTRLTLEMCMALLLIKDRLGPGSASGSHHQSSSSSSSPHHGSIYHPPPSSSVDNSAPYDTTSYQAFPNYKSEDSQQPQ